MGLAGVERGHVGEYRGDGVFVGEQGGYASGVVGEDGVGEGGEGEGGVKGLRLGWLGFVFELSGLECAGVFGFCG